MNFLDDILRMARTGIQWEKYRCPACLTPMAITGDGFGHDWSFVVRCPHEHTSFGFGISYGLIELKDKGMVEVDGIFQEVKYQIDVGYFRMTKDFGDRLVKLLQYG